MVSSCTCVTRSRLYLTTKVTNSTPITMTFPSKPFNMSFNHIKLPSNHVGLSNSPVAVANDESSIKFQNRKMINFHRGGKHWFGIIRGTHLDSYTVSGEILGPPVIRPSLALSAPTFGLVHEHPGRKYSLVH
jgi:hypothetical protein